MINEYIITETDSHIVISLPPAPAPALVSPLRDITHLEFRRRFTVEEQELADELEVLFESNATLSVEQKRKLRTGYKNFYAASMVNLDDPAIPPMLDIYEELGIIAPGRKLEILA